jgi:hypothetical protein
LNSELGHVVNFYLVIIASSHDTVIGCPLHRTDSATAFNCADGINCFDAGFLALQSTFNRFVITLPV